MGRKVAMAACGLGGMSMLFTLVALQFPMHQMSFRILTVPTQRYQLFLLKVGINPKSQEKECHLLEKDTKLAKVKKAMSQVCMRKASDYEEHYIDNQDFANDWCTEIAMQYFGNWCDGLQWARIVGPMILACVLIELCVGFGCFYLVWDYAYGKAQRKKITTAVTLLAVFTGTKMVLFMVWILTVTLHMDSPGKSQLFVGMSGGTGVSGGVFLHGMAVAFSVAQTILLHIGGRSPIDEEIQAVLKESKQVDQDNMYGAIVQQTQMEVAGLAQPQMVGQPQMSAQPYVMAQPASQVVYYSAPA